MRSGGRSGRVCQGIRAESSWPVITARAGTWAERVVADPSVRVSTASWNADVVPEIQLFEEVGRRP